MNGWIINKKEEKGSLPVPDTEEGKEVNIYIDIGVQYVYVIECVCSCVSEVNEPR